MKTRNGNEVINADHCDSRLPLLQSPDPNPRKPGRIFRRIVATLSALSLLFLLASVVLFLTSLVTSDGPYTPLDLKTLGLFELDPLNGTTADVPARSYALNGKRVILNGFMWKNSLGDRTDTFQLVHDFGNRFRPPRVQDRVFARLHFGRKIPLDLGFVAVYGTLHVTARRSDGVIQSVFELDVDKVLPEPISVATPAYYRTGMLAAITAFIAAVLVAGKYLKAVYAMKKNAKKGLCRRCGYDLRATPDRCPECGMASRSVEPVRYWEGTIGSR